jgi:hypothetical protein
MTRSALADVAKKIEERQDRADRFALMTARCAIELAEGLASELQARRQQNAARLCRHLLELELEYAYVRSRPDGETVWLQDYATWWRKNWPGDEPPSDARLAEIWRDGESGQQLPSRMKMTKHLGRDERWWLWTYGRLSGMAHPGLRGSGRYVRALFDEGADPRIDPDELAASDTAMFDWIGLRAIGALAHLLRPLSEEADRDGT